MKGQNALILSEATMIEVMQWWLRRHMAEEVPTVTAFTPLRGTRQKWVFEVEVDGDRDGDPCGRCGNGEH